MPSILDVAAPAKVCTCYAREDDSLREELHAHLSTLQRLGLIQSWYDRDIAPGTDWEGQIDEHLKDADFILLLISAHFINSKYCYEIEMKYALQRHEEGSAVVIPILLRPVNYHGLPFARLQALPADGRFVVNSTVSDTRESAFARDSAYSSIAEDLRKAISGFRTNKIQGYKTRTGADWVQQRRALDASVATEIPKGETREVIALVSVEGSEGLRFILADDANRTSSERIYSSSVDDVRAAAFEIQLPLTDAGFVRSPSLVLKIASPGFDPPIQEKRIAVPTLSDSRPYSFIIRGDLEGQHAINVELICDDIAVVEQLLKTRVAQHGGPDRTPPTGGGIVLATVSLQTVCIAKAAFASG